MLKLRRSSHRQDAQRSNLPWRPIVLFVLAITVMEVARSLTLDDSIYAQDTPLSSYSAPTVHGAENVAVRTAALASEPIDSSIRIVAIYGPNSVRAGEVVNYRVRLADGTKQPVIYRWNMGDGTRAEGNNVTHRYMRPGKYNIVATAENRVGSDTKSLSVVVTGNVIVPVPEVEEVVSERDTGAARRTAERITPAKVKAPASHHPRDAAFRGSDPLSWSDGGYTLMFSTSSDRKSAERTAVDLRRRGLRSGIYIDDTGFGNPVYRVVVGHFGGEGDAVRARQVLISEGFPGAFIVHPMPQR